MHAGAVAVGAGECPDTAAVDLYHSAGNGEAKPGAAVAAVADRLGVEEVEDLVPIRFGDADPDIDDVDDEVGVASITLNSMGVPAGE